MPPMTQITGAHPAPIQNMEGSKSPPGEPDKGEDPLKSLNAPEGGNLQPLPPLKLEY